MWHNSEDVRFYCWFKGRSTSYQFLSGTRSDRCSGFAKYTHHLPLAPSAALHLMHKFLIHAAVYVTRGERKHQLPTAQKICTRCAAGWTRRSVKRDVKLLRHSRFGPSALPRNTSDNSLWTTYLHSKMNDAGLCAPNVRHLQWAVAAYSSQWVTVKK